MNFTLKKSDLNFKVYTVETKPSTPGAENDIAIISPVPMTNWLMSPDKPSGIPKNDGDVWIQYSTQGNTKNILKQNTMMIATISAWQYVDGAWVDREAVSCQGGEWVDWFSGVYLFNDGNEYTDLTGGWTNDGYTYLYNLPFGSIVNNGGRLTFNFQSGSTYSGGGTAKKIDITNKTILRVSGTLYSGSTYVHICVGSTKNLSEPVASKREDLSAGSSYEVDFDISTVPGGSYYIGGCFNGYVSKVVLM